MKILIITLFCFFSLTLIAQNKTPRGYYGKRNYVEFALNTNLHFVYISDYKPTTTHYNQKLSPLNVGFNFQIGRVLKYNKGIALHVSNILLKSYSPFDFHIPTTSTLIAGNFDLFQTNTTTIMPMYTSSYFLTAPLGLEFEAGIGYNRMRIFENDMKFTANHPEDQQYFESLLQNVQLFDFSQKFHSYSFMLGLKSRFALTDKLLFNAGFRYTYTSKLRNENYKIDPYFENNFDLHLVNFASRAFSNRLIVFNFGLSYVF
jgi:opacity protein-like surface antigen